LNFLQNSLSPPTVPSASPRPESSMAGPSRPDTSKPPVSEDEEQAEDEDEEVDEKERMRRRKVEVLGYFTQGPKYRYIPPKDMIFVKLTHPKAYYYMCNLCQAQFRINSTKEPGSPRISNLEKHLRAQHPDVALHYQAKRFKRY